MAESDAGAVGMDNAMATGRSVRTVLRRLVLLGTPLTLSLLEILHPQPGGVGEA
jgi:hypothetical protein